MTTALLCMMGTQAYHRVKFDVSRKKPSVCLIYGEDGKYHIGKWADGKLNDVYFPKDCTRRLTKEELAGINGKEFLNKENAPFTINIPKDF